MWRCHIDVANPVPDVWDNIKRYVKNYDAAIFSVAKFSRALPISEFIMTPSIDPLSEKNKDLTDKEVDEICDKIGRASCRERV